MSRSIHITADLEISSDTHQVTVISNKEEIGIAITGHSIPKLGSHLVNKLFIQGDEIFAKKFCCIDRSASYCRF